MLEKLALKSPLRYTGAPGWASASSPIVIDKLESSSKNLDSWPRVGRYTAIWILRGESGGWKMTGRKAAEETGKMVICGSCWTFHRAKVPPLALDLISGRSGSNLSAELREAV